MLKLQICAVGRARRGPEADLFGDYMQRFNKAGSGIGLGPLSLSEVEDKSGRGMSAEATLLEKAAPKHSLVVCLDERGTVEKSPAFANRLAHWRDEGQSSAVFLIGGADGLDPELRRKADHLLSFGPMVWPHMLVRVMLAKQLYRAASILSGSPYHRA